MSLVGGCLQLFSRQDKLVERRAFFPLSEGRLVVTASLWVDAPLLYPSWHVAVLNKCVLVDLCIPDPGCQEDENILSGFYLLPNLSI